MYKDKLSHIVDSHVAYHPNYSYLWLFVNFSQAFINLSWAYVLTYVLHYDLRWAHKKKVRNERNVYKQFAIIVVVYPPSVS